MRISEIIHDRVERYRDRTFLKAAMAASALTAYADGSVSLSERFKVEDILERLERLHIYDALKAVEKFEAYVSELEDNTDEAEKVLLGKLERMASDRDQLRRQVLQSGRAHAVRRDLRRTGPGGEGLH